MMSHFLQNLRGICVWMHNIVQGFWLNGDKQVICLPSASPMVGADVIIVIVMSNQSSCLILQWLLPDVFMMVIHILSCYAKQSMICIFTLVQKARYVNCSCYLHTKLATAVTETLIWRENVCKLLIALCVLW